MQLNYKGLTLSIYLTKNLLSLIFAFNSKPIYFKVIPLNDASEITDHLIRETSGSSILKIERHKLKQHLFPVMKFLIIVVQTLKKVLGLDFIPFNPFDKIRPQPELYESKFI